MSHGAFLIDLASVRPAHPPTRATWPAVAREHASQVVRCIQRILAHTDTSSVTTHIFDSTALAQSSHPSTKPLKESLEDLRRLPELVGAVDIKGVKHPSANGLAGGLADAIADDPFDNFYAEATYPSDVFIIARAPATLSSLAAFAGTADDSLSELEIALSRLRYLRAKLNEFSKRKMRLVWVDSTPRRCEKKGDFDIKVSQAFEKWFCSHSPDFRFAGLSSFLLDRKIASVRDIVTSLRNGRESLSANLGHNVDVLCVQDVRLVRCLSASMNCLTDPLRSSSTSQTFLVLTGLRRRPPLQQLALLQAFDSPARLLTPAVSHGTSRTDSHRWPSIFAGLMVDLARESACLTADMFEIDEGDQSFSRIQTFIEPITPLSAIVRKVSLSESGATSHGLNLPHTFLEWIAWDKLRSIRDCETSDAAIDASAKFFETYLPDLFTTAESSKVWSEISDGLESTKETAFSSQRNDVLLSFESNAKEVRGRGKEYLGRAVRSLSSTSVPMARTDVHDSKSPCRDSVMKDVVSRLRPEPVANREKGGLKGFTWRRKTRVMAPKTPPFASDEEVGREIMQPPLCAQAVRQNKETFTSPSALASKTLNRSPPSQTETCPTSARNCSDMQVDSCQLSSSPQSPVPDAPRDEQERMQDLVEWKQDEHAPSDPATNPDQVCNESHLLSARKVARIRRVPHGNGKPVGSNENVVVEEKFPKSPQDGILLPEEPRSVQRAHDGNPQQFQDDVDIFEASAQKIQDVNEDLRSSVWTCIDNISSLAKTLSLSNSSWNGITQVLDIKRKTVKEISDVMQCVQMRSRNDSSRPADVILIREAWAALISAFAQVVYHLAEISLDANAPNRSHRKRLREHAQKATTILVCAQFMAEMTARNQATSVSFREVFDKLFSSVLVHFCSHPRSGKSVQAVRRFFDKFEQTHLLAAAAGEKKTESDTVYEKRSCDAPCDPDKPAKEGTRPSQHKKKPRSSPSSNGAMQLRKGVKKRSRAAKPGQHSTVVAQARNKKLPKTGFGRPQFAQHYDVVQNAVNRQTRLSLRSLVHTKRSVSPGGKEAQKKTHRPLDARKLRSILATTTLAIAQDETNSSDFAHGEPDDSVGRRAPDAHLVPQENGHTEDLPNLSLPKEKVKTRAVGQPSFSRAEKSPSISRPLTRLQATQMAESTSMQKPALPSLLFGSSKSRKQEGQANGTLTGQKRGRHVDLGDQEVVQVSSGRRTRQRKQQSVVQPEKESKGGTDGQTLRLRNRLISRSSSPRGSRLSPRQAGENMRSRSVSVFEEDRSTPELEAKEPKIDVLSPETPVTLRPSFVPNTFKGTISGMDVLQSGFDQHAEIVPETPFVPRLSAVAQRPRRPVRRTLHFGK